MARTNHPPAGLQPRMQRGPASLLAADLTIAAFMEETVAKIITKRSDCFCDRRRTFHYSGSEAVSFASASAAIFWYASALSSSVLLVMGSVS
jgi:hypothetical protein